MREEVKIRLRSLAWYFANPIRILYDKSLFADLEVWYMIEWLKEQKEKFMNSKQWREKLNGSETFNPVEIVDSLEEEEKTSAKLLASAEDWKRLYMELSDEGNVTADKDVTFRNCKFNATPGVIVEKARVVNFIRCNIFKRNKGARVTIEDLIRKEGRIPGGDERCEQ
jgi:hypothetical protein